MDYRHISGRSLSGRHVSGRALGVRVSGGSQPSLSPGTPELEWDGDSTDNRPDFVLILPSGHGAPSDAAIGDILRIERMVDPGGSWVSYLTHTLVSDDILALPFDVSGVSPLSNNSYLFRARLERGSLIGSWSASEAVTVNAPTARNVILVMRAR